MTTPMIQRMYNELLREKELSPKNVKNVHNVLHRALEPAQKMGFIRTNPTEAVTLPRIEKKQIKPLEDEELTAFLTSGMKKESASRMDQYIHSVTSA